MSARNLLLVCLGRFGRRRLHPGTMTLQNANLYGSPMMRWTRSVVCSTVSSSDLLYHERRTPDAYGCCGLEFVFIFILTTSWLADENARWSLLFLRFCWACRLYAQ